MPPPNDDFQFQFDVTPFNKAVQEITKGLTKMGDQFKNFSTKNQQQGKKAFTPTIEGIKATQKDTQMMVKTTGSAIGKWVKRIALAAVAFIAIRKIISKITSAIPEIGTSFAIAGGIITRNLFFPLRKLIVPMLQRMLDWVRRNRTMFIKWGEVIANVFRIAVSLGKGLIKVLKIMFDSFKKALGVIFGDMPTSIERVINILTFKIAVLVQFLLIALEPIAAAIGKIIGKIIELGTSFAKNFVEGFKGVGGLSKNFVALKDAVGGLVTDLGKLFKAISDNKAVIKFFKDFGRVVGAIFTTVLQTNINLLTDAITTLRALLKLELPELGELETVKTIKNIAKATGEATGKAVDVSLKKTAAFFEGLKDIGVIAPFLPAKKEEIVKDAIIKPGGQVIRTDPRDTIIATKGAVAVGPEKTTRNIIVSLGELVIRGALTVTEGSAQIAGQEFVRGVGKQVYLELLDELAGEGEFAGGGG